eukprot:PITA_33752
MMDHVVDISPIVELDIKCYKQGIFGPRFSKMQRNLSKPVTIAREKDALEVGIDLTEAQINRLQQINELDEIRLSALQNIALIQQQRAKWHDALIKNKVFHEGDWALLYDSRFQDFPGKLQTRWLGPYEIQKVHDNGTLTLITIDGSGYAFKANGH